MVVTLEHILQVISSVVKCPAVLVVSNHPSRGIHNLPVHSDPVFGAVGIVSPHCIPSAVRFSAVPAIFGKFFIIFVVAECVPSMRERDDFISCRVGKRCNSNGDVIIIVFTLYQHLIRAF